MWWCEGSLEILPAPSVCLWSSPSGWCKSHQGLDSIELRAAVQFKGGGPRNRIMIARERQAAFESDLSSRQFFQREIPLSYSVT